jgi:transposase-like protein
MVYTDESHAAIPHRSPTVQVNIKNLVDDVQCYQTVRELRWPDGVACPSCESTHVIKRGFDDTEPALQRYECHDCDQRFDDVTDTIFAGHHQPLKVWILCLYHTVRTNFREKRRIEISSWNEQTHHHHSRAHR